MTLKLGMICRIRLISYIVNLPCSVYFSCLAFYVSHKISCDKLNNLVALESDSKNVPPNEERLIKHNPK